MITIDLKNPLICFKILVEPHTSTNGKTEKSKIFPVHHSASLKICALFKDGTGFTTSIDEKTKNNARLSPIDYFGGHSKIIEIKGNAETDERKTTTIWRDTIGTSSFGVKRRMLCNFRNAGLFTFLPLCGAEDKFFAIFQKGGITVRSISNPQQLLADVSCAGNGEDELDGFPFFADKSSTNFIDFFATPCFDKDSCFAVLVTQLYARVWKISFSENLLQGKCSSSYLSMSEEISVSLSKVICFEKQATASCGVNFCCAACNAVLTRSVANNSLDDSAGNTTTETPSEEEKKTKVIPVLLTCHNDGDIKLWGLEYNKDKTDEQYTTRTLAGLHLDEAIHHVPEPVPASTPIPFASQDEEGENGSLLWDKIISSRLGIAAVRKGTDVYVVDFRVSPSRIVIQTVFKGEKDDSYRPLIAFRNSGYGDALAISRRGRIDIAAPSTDLSYVKEWPIVGSFGEDTKEHIPRNTSCTALSWDRHGALIAAYGAELAIYGTWSIPNTERRTHFHSAQNHCVDEELRERAKDEENGRLEKADFRAEVSSLWGSLSCLQGALTLSTTPTTSSLPIYHPFVLTTLIRESKMASLALICHSLLRQIEVPNGNAAQNFYIDPIHLLTEDAATKKLVEDVRNETPQKKHCSKKASSNSEREEEISTDEQKEQESSMENEDENDNISSFDEDLTETATLTSGNAKDIVNNVLKTSIKRLLDSIGSLSLPGVSGIEQMQICAILETVADVQVLKTGSLDSCGLRFLIAKRLFNHHCRVRKLSQETTRMATSDFAWALHSEAQMALIQECCQSDGTWEVLRSYGIGYWATTSTVTTALIEHLAKAHFSKNKKPDDAALFYIMLGKKTTLCGLYRACKETRVANFLANDFTTAKWKTAAARSAYTLNSQHRYALSAAFFLLSGSLDDCIQAIVQKLNDIQLALLVARHCGDTEAEKRVIIKYVIPQALEEGDAILLSISHWLMKEHLAAFQILTDMRAYKKGTDPAVLSYAQHLSSLPLIRLANDANRATNERAIARRAVISHCVVGSTFIAASITKEYRLLDEPPEDTIDESLTQDKVTEKFNDDKSINDTASNTPAEDDWDFDTSTKPKQQNDFDWDFDTTPTKKTDNYDWDFDTTPTQKKNDLNWDFDDDDEDDGADTKQSEVNSREDESEDASGEDGKKKEKATGKETTWERQVLYHTLLDAAERSIIALIKGADFLVSGDKSPHNEIAKTKLDNARNLMKFWTEQIGLDKAELERRAVKALFSFGYYGTLPLFSLGTSSGYNTIVETARSSRNLINYAFTVSKDNAMLIEVFARRLLYLCTSFKLGEELLRTVHLTTYYLLFASALSRGDSDALKILLSKKDIESAVETMTTSLTVERLVGTTTLGKFKNVELESRTWKLFADHINNFKKAVEYPFFSSVLYSLGEFAKGHPSHSITEEPDGISPKRDDEEYEEEVKDFKRFLDDCTKSKKNSTGWYVTTTGKGCWHESPNFPRRVVVQHKEPISSFCFSSCGALGAFSSRGSVHEFTSNLVPGLQRPSVFLRAGIEKLYQRVNKFGAATNEVRSEITGVRAGIGDEWVERMPGFPYYLATNAEKPLCLYHFKHDFIKEPVARFPIKSGHGAALKCVFNDTGSLAAAALDNGYIEVWSVPRATASETGESFYTAKAHQRRTNSITFLNEGTILATAGAGSKSNSPTVCLWDTLDHSRRSAAATTTKAKATAINSSADKNYLIVGDKDGYLRIFPCSLLLICITIDFFFYFEIVSTVLTKFFIICTPQYC